MESLVDGITDMLLPQFTAEVFNVISDIQSCQKPPFSDGVYWLEIRKEWRRRDNGVLLTIIPVLFDPLMTRLFHLDQLYMSQDGTKYSVKKLKTLNLDKKTGEYIEDEYFTYSEGMKHKFPGYALGSDNIVRNGDSPTVDL